MQELLEVIENQPENIDARMELVQRYVKNHDYANAKTMLREVLEINPDHIDANFVLGQICEFDEEFSEAVKCFEKIVSLHPVPDMKYKLAQLYENANQDKKALELFEELYESNKDNQDIITQLAHLNTVLGNKEKAIDLYNKLLIVNPQDMVALSQLMDLYEDTNRYLYYSTRAKIQEMEGTLSHALSSYKKALAEADNNEEITNTRLCIADILVQKENYLQAVDEYLALIQLEIEDFDVYKSLGDAYVELENPEAAAEAYEKALNLDSDNSELAQELSNLYVETENYEKALKLLNELTQKDSMNLSARVNLARVYIATSKDFEAQDALNYVLNKEPNNVEAIGVYVDFYILKKDYEKATEYTNKIKELLPKSPFGYRKAAEVNEILGEAYGAHYNYGVYHDLKGEKQLAIDEFTCALNYDPTNYEICLKLARLNEDISEYYIAIDYYQKASQLNKENAFALEKMAEIYSKKKDVDKLIELYNEIIKVEPANKEAYFNLANAYESKKKYDLALENYKKYVELAPKSNKADEARAKIETLENKINPPEEEGLLNKIFRIFK